MPKGASLMQALVSLKHLDSSLFLEPKDANGAIFALKPGYQTAVWSRTVATDHVLRDLDRIEVLRPIKVDPKVARRERFKKQGAKGAKGAGLFAKQRPGSKAGY